MQNDKLSIPAAIIVAGLIIAGGVYASGMHKPDTDSIAQVKKSISAKLGLDEKKMQACILADTYKDKIQKDTESGDRAMASISADSRGTPYNVLLDTKTGKTIKIAGAYPYDAFKQAVDGLLAGTIKSDSVNLDPIVATDHFFGNKSAQIVLVEYGDMECPYCAEVHPTIQKLLADYNGKVAWVFRNFPLSIHANAQVKAEAAECASAQGGDNTYFKYVDSLYGAIREQIHPTFDTTTL